ncbi:ABC transporter permease [Mucilaginibacter auburnensis]|uniref:ABC-type antimicrobial peptide transport system permease subunit n=1 Tax=Mucilaginibacter auburnensis TaxID=1457233 RepID=A0A2H9VLN3_9SPHI|nr:ABC transporter permease [Mucilaginibacter auburnensis]PJJ79234.1 ABC-type antimicrobial peptide transport system permease subunit [Mucilaginibacter auburnensis]
MLKNYFKTAWRNVLKHKMYSAINIGGLAIGMAVSFLLLLYVYSEFTYNNMHVKGDRIYKFLRNQPSEGVIYTSSVTPAPLAPAVEKDYPEIEKVARNNGTSDMLAGYGDVNIKLPMMASDPAILDIFTFDFVKGKKSKALDDPSSIVITEKAAKALFGDADPIGKSIRLNDNKFSLKVSAVIKDHPQNSSFRFDMLMPWGTYGTQQPWIKSAGWGNYSFTTYALLKPGATVDAVNIKLKDITKRYDPNNKDNIMFLHNWRSLRLNGEFKNGVNTGGSIEYVRLFLYLAIGILLIACINFMNLSTARSEHRAREVGVRKAIGAHRWSIVQQFLGESMLMAFMAFFASIVIMMLLLPVFRDIIGTPMELPYQNPWAWTAALIVTVVTGFVAGSYPALFLSSFKPIKVLKGQLITTKTTVRPRQFLVVMQFTFAICLILSSLFIYKQINYIKERPLGYNNKGVLEMDVEGALVDRFEDFRRDAIASGAIIDGALTSGSITDNGSSSWGITWPDQRPGEAKIPIDQLVVTYHFTGTYGVEMVQGHDYDINRPADTAGIILNESAVKLMRLKHPLGAQVKWQGDNRTVIGVTKDFVWGSPYEPVKPAIVGFMKDWTGSIGLKLNPAKSITESLALIKNVYKKYNTQYPFEYKFTDERFDSKFKTEKLLGTMATCFTGLAIVISCLGLFGLASFSAEQRRKEIGIRKVLGANTAHLWLKLSQEFIKLVLISFLIGAAISWYNIDKWLAKYTYHTPISLWVFIATMLVSIALCLITVSWQAIRAAWANPVKSLKSE